MIGNLIADAMEKVGKDGVITVEESKTMKTELTVVEGMQFDRGYASSYMVHRHGEDGSRSGQPLHSDYRQEDFQHSGDHPPAGERSCKSGKKLLIIAEDVEGEALATLVLNKLRGTFTCVAVKAPGFGDRRKAMLQDIAVLTGGQVITEELGLDLKEATIDMLGTARQVKIDKENTVIVEGGGDPDEIKARIASIRAQIEDTTSDYDREKLQERLAKLSGGVAVINVGAATEVEMKERKLRIEDALAATRAAVEEGIVPGGGTALINASKAVAKLVPEVSGDAKTGVNIVLRALEEPVRQIAANAGVEGSHHRREDQVQEVRFLRLRRLQGRVLRHDRARHHRPDQGYPFRSAERRLRRRHGADHRVHRHRHPRSGTGSRSRQPGHGRHVLSKLSLQAVAAAQVTSSPVAPWRRSGDFLCSYRHFLPINRGCRATDSSAPSAFVCSRERGNGGGLWFYGIADNVCDESRHPSYLCFFMPAVSHLCLSQSRRSNRPGAHVWECRVCLLAISGGS